MEKVLSIDERIRRAQQVYYKRKMQLDNNQTARVSVNYDRKSFGLLKKLFLQITICFVIYIIIYLVQTTDFIFSPNVLEKTKQMLNYDIDIVKIYNQSFGYLNGVFSKKAKEENKLEDNAEQNKIENTTAEENIGGEETVVEENLSQMEKDARDILASKSLIIPLVGIITSRYGLRDSENPKVPKYHTGIDIAVNEGTTFVAAMSGTVTKVSNQGDYRSSFNDSK